MSDYDILSSEIVNDPLTVGYSGMTDQQRYDALTTTGSPYGRPAPERTSIEANILFESIDRTEWTTAAPDAAFQARLDRMLGLGNILVGPGSQGRTELLALFDNTNWPTTRSTLINYVQNQVQTRAQELGVRVTMGLLQTIRSNTGV